VEAVLHFSAEASLDPKQALSDAFPMLRVLYGAGLLVEEGSASASAILPLFSPGDRVGDFTVEQCIQALNDSDVYLTVRDGQRFAIKIARSSKNAPLRHMLEHEHRIFGLLQGDPTPRPVALSEHEARPFIVTEWCESVSALVAAHELRRRAPRRQLLELCCAVLDAYATLHAKRVVHGDVHPRNVLVRSDGSVTLVDFGLARAEALPEDIDRAGVAYFFEPAYAKAILARKKRPAATPEGEQYGLAALLYLLLTGSHYLDFSVQKTAMFRQITEETPLPFQMRQVEPWPEVEAVLAKGLRKTPELRYASVAEFAAALRNASCGDAIPRGGMLARRRMLRSVIEALGAESPLLRGEGLVAPKCSVTYGAAGIAYVWYRLALLEDDPTHLTNADLWSHLAMSIPWDDAAFFNPAIEIRVEEIGTKSLYHTEPGIHCVAALTSHALGDFDRTNSALKRYIESTGRGNDRIDLTLGRSGLLLGSALLLEALSSSVRCDVRPLAELCENLAEATLRDIDAQPPIGEDNATPYLGIAHGSAGQLFGLLRAQEALGRPPSNSVEHRLLELAKLSRDAGQGGLWWPRRLNTVVPDLASSWCSGAAGHLLLFLLAHRHFPRAGFLDVAERAARFVWSSHEGNASLCCGLAGRAYALLAFHRASSAPEWLTRARELCERAAAQGVARDVPYSLYKGNLGIALLAAELDRPELARFPMFEAEGWRAE
jgi:serine/threonine-protein kinase